MALRAVQEFLDWLHEPYLQAGGLSITPLLTGKLILYPALAVLVAHSIRRGMVRAIAARGAAEEHIQNRAATLVYYIVLVIGVGTALAEAGVNLQNLTVASGAVGLGIGLGMQDFARNFVGGVQILLGRNIKPKDWITVGEVEGAVIEVGGYSTVIRTLDNGDVLVPNSALLGGQSTNWTKPGLKRRVSAPIGVAYGSDEATVRRILLEAAMECPDVLSEPAPEVYHLGFGDSSVNFSLMAFTSSLADNPALFRSRLYSLIGAKLRSGGVEIPFRQLDVHVRSQPPGDRIL